MKPKLLELVRKARKSIIVFRHDLSLFVSELVNYIIKKLHVSFLKFEAGKGFIATSLYKQRGRRVKSFIHSGMAGVAGLGIIIAPVVAQEFPGKSVDPWTIPTSTNVLSGYLDDVDDVSTQSSNVKGEIIQYTVVEGDTLGSIADKFGVSLDTVRWQNNLETKDAIKVGQTLEILPITGVAHKVKKGDTVYSIAKKYDVDAQVIVNYPFNSFSNDETFALAIGQTIIVPDGVKPKEVPWSPGVRVKQITPDAGTVVASGQFIWPAGGTMSQRFVWYHKGLDIANKGGPNILAADAGTIVVAGWPDNSGYGNRVIIDHGNGYKTLYAHLSNIFVVPGQRVNRGDSIGKMGSTGRSTGTHLHFEVIKDGGRLNPLTVLK